jgi:diguanylate cyclase (GGDEF)-like protein
MFFDRRGLLYGGTFSGAIVRIDPRTGRTQQVGKAPAFIMKSLVDSTGRVFFATKQGMYVLDAGIHGNRSSSQGWKSGITSGNPASTERSYSGSSFQPHRVPAVDALLGQPNRVEAGCEAPDGVLWFLANNRLLRLKDGQWSLPPIDGMPRTRGSLLDLSCAQNGAIWVTGEQAGTWKLTPGNDRLEAWELNLPTELRSLTPLAILIDRRGWVWLGTDLGLVVWNGRNYRHLTQESGLIWNDIDQGALQTGADGSLWIGASGGLAHLRHPERVFEPAPLGVSVTAIRRGENVYPADQPVTMPWTSLPLRLQISSPAMRNRSDLLFKYRIEELQSDWIESQDGVAVFPALAPGEYTFDAMAYNPALSAYSGVVRVHVRILPPWWRSAWFQALSSLASEMDRARREKRTLVVALVDLDHFKRVNDAYGHMAGDEALRWFSAAVGTAIRPYDHAGRYGGEEFLLILTEVPPASVSERLDVLHGAISNLQIQTRDFQFTCACSMGATVFDPSAGPGSVESLLAIADAAMYAAKAQGRNRVVLQLAGASIQPEADSLLHSN